MSTIKFHNKSKSFPFKHLSIQQSLPLVICILLLTVVLTFSWVSYIAVKDASIAIGTERVTTLVDKLSLMFKESINQMTASAKPITNRKSVKDYLISGGNESRVEAINVLQKFEKKDTLCKLIQLLNVRKQNVLSFGTKGIHLHVNIDSLALPPSGKGGFISVGKIILFRDSMYYPVVNEVSDKNNLIGYVVNWQVIRTTQKSIDQLAQLLGGNGKLYFGNDDEKFWTDLRKPVPKPPVELSKLQNVAQYSRNDGEPIMGSVRKIPNSRWLVLVELSSSSFLKTANLFLRWVFIIGAVLIIVGSVAGWVMSRNITIPLKELNQAASSFAEGDYSSSVDLNRDNELGELAKSFNTMAARVRTAQQDLEQKVQERTRELRMAIIDINNQKENEKKKDEFISVASHELKTPLTTIKAFFQLTARELQPESKPFNLIGKALRQLDRMERLIADLLDVSKINSGKMQYNLETFNFQDLLKEAVESVQEISPNHHLAIEKSASVIFSGDRHRIEQVIFNLLNNSVKYSPGADKVIIRSELQDDKLLVTVKDFGIGIEEKHVNELFDRFYRIDVNHRFQGLGLGLFISSEIIKRHHGKIWVKSEFGKGTEFTFELPLTVAEKYPLAQIQLDEEQNRTLL